MKNLTTLLILLLAFSACKEPKNDSEKMAEITVFTEDDTKEVASYPQSVQDVFEAHGGMDRWNAMNNLCYEIPKPNGPEVHTISLKDRRTRIETKDWTIGSDGSNVWLAENADDSYKGNARFYHNLMFYFYAMPFVLGDDGINYEKVEPTELDGKTYEGIKVGYNEGVGDSPKDEYILYFDPETKVMSWLAYTVTYRTNEKADKWSYIKYSKWNPVNGLTLPKTLTWYEVEDGKPTKPRNEMAFEKITLTKTELEDAVFAKPESAEIIPR